MTYLASTARRRRWAASLGDLIDLIPFPSSVEAWRSLLERYRGDIPINFLLAWLAKESGGNPCSWTSLREAGIFQLMQGDNQNVAGVTEAQLRASCIGETQQSARNLTTAEAELQVASGMQYVRWARDVARQKLAAAGAKWSESSTDFWKMVKLVHAYPGYINGWLAAATSKFGRPPASWDEFRSAISGYASVLDNAEEVGGRADVSSGGISPITLLILGGGLGLLYLVSR